MQTYVTNIFNKHVEYLLCRLFQSEIYALLPKYPALNCMCSWTRDWLPLRLAFCRMFGPMMCILGKKCGENITACTEYIHNFSSLLHLSFMFDCLYQFATPLSGSCANSEDSITEFEILIGSWGKIRGPHLPFYKNTPSPPISSPQTKHTPLEY